LTPRPGWLPCVLLPSPLNPATPAVTGVDDVAGVNDAVACCDAHAMSAAQYAASGTAVVMLVPNCGPGTPDTCVIYTFHCAGVSCAAADGAAPLLCAAASMGALPIACNSPYV